MKIGFVNESMEKLLSKFTHNRPKFYFSILPTDPKPDKKCSQRDFFGPSSFKKARFGSISLRSLIGKVTPPPELMLLDWTEKTLKLHHCCHSVIE